MAIDILHQEGRSKEGGKSKKTVTTTKQLAAEAALFFFARSRSRSSLSRSAI